MKTPRYDAVTGVGSSATIARATAATVDVLLTMQQDTGEPTRSLCNLIASYKRIMFMLIQGLRLYRRVVL